MSLRTCCVKNLSPVQLLDHVLFHLKVGKSSFFQNVSRPIIIKLNINYESTPQLPPYSSTSEPFYNVTTLVSPVTDTYLSVHSFHSSLSKCLETDDFSRRVHQIDVSPDWFSPCNAWSTSVSYFVRSHWDVAMINKKTIMSNNLTSRVTLCRQRSMCGLWRSVLCML